MTSGWHPKSSSVPPDFHLHSIGFEPRTFFEIPGSQIGAMPLSHHHWGLGLSFQNQILHQFWRNLWPQFLHLIHIGILKYITWRCPVSYLFGEFLSKGNIVLWKWNILASTPFFIMEIRLRMTENCFLGQVVITIHVYWPQFSEFIEITSPSKSKSAQGCSWFHQENEGQAATIIMNVFKVCINTNDLSGSISIFDNNIRLKMQMNFLHLLWLKNGSHVHQTML
jgi:hypothetical protein